ncbi:MAG: hypothetical protein LBV44_05300 [Methylobacillus sp.]|jgi:hypothetical protein|nr:hypothetical protein [Methylobacillus sp.]
MNWQLLPRRGIRFGEAEIVVGAPRAEVRQALAGYFPPPENHRRESEDQYRNNDGKVFLRYDDADTLKEILCVAGSVQLDGLELLDTTWSQLIPQLESRGHTPQEPEYFVDGQDFPALGINIATREDVGGDEDDDQIEWVSVWRVG